MGDVMESTFTIIVSTEFIMGNLGNGFIAVVNCMDWIKRRKIFSVDHILTALAISRIGLLWVVLLDWLASVFCPALQMIGKMTRMIYITWTVTNHFNIWLSTSLSIFYFLKIANFSSSIFLYLKIRVKKLVSVTLLMSVFLLFLNIIVINTYVEFLNDGVKTNMSSYSSLRNSGQFSKLLSFTNPIFTFIPFTMSLTTCLLLIFSLWKHVRRMRCNATGCRDASTKAHIKALRTVTTSLLLYTIFFLSLFVKVWSSELQERYLVHLFVRAVAIVFPAGHSFVLILGNSKLRRASRSVRWWLKCRSKGTESSDP